MRLLATMACYTFFERSWHAKCQSMSKWVTPLTAVMQLAKNTQLNHSMAPKEPQRKNKWADVSPLLKYVSGAVAPRLKAPKGPL